MRSFTDRYLMKGSPPIASSALLVISSGRNACLDNVRKGGRIRNIPAECNEAIRAGSAQHGLAEVTHLPVQFFVAQWAIKAADGVLDEEFENPAVSDGDRDFHLVFVNAFFRLGPDLAPQGDDLRIRDDLVRIFVLAAAAIHDGGRA